jgi:hypothetical protein
VIPPPLFLVLLTSFAPKVRFLTPVYHPNIDSEGRICLNLLKMPPKGVWTPAYDVAAVLSGVQILLAQPNPDDPLMTDITDEYRTNHELFLRKAREYTIQHAVDDSIVTAPLQGAAPAPRVDLPSQGQNDSGSAPQPSLSLQRDADGRRDHDGAIVGHHGTIIPSPQEVPVFQATLSKKKLRLF